MKLEARHPEVGVRIDPEFQELVPVLAEQELSALEENLLRDGCRDPLVIWKGHGILLDGHHRLRLCRQHKIPYATTEVLLPDRDAAKVWVITNQFGRRNLTPYQRSELALKLKPFIAEKAKKKQGRRTDLCQNSDKSAPSDTKRELARVAGLSHDTLAKAEYIQIHADDATRQKLRRGEVTINAAYHAVRKAQVRRERQERKSRRVVLPDDACRMVCCDIRDAAKHVEAGSVDWVVTDPPYPKQYLPLFSALGSFAAHALRPGGSLVCMCGQSWLPEVYRLMSEHLTYRWTLAYLTPGQSAKVWDRKVSTFWKPLLWFTNGKYEGDWVGDVCRSEANDKNHHHWGQSVSGMVDVLKRFADPGDVVCDPFLGGGTTAVAARICGCRFIGMDLDEACLDTTRQRLADTPGREA